MTTLRIASVNGEWMNNWFTSDGMPAAFVRFVQAPWRKHFKLDGQDGFQARG